MMKKQVKAIISTLLILCLLYLAVTGALMYFGKTGVVWGVSRNTLRGSHFWVAISICALVVVHLILNFRVYLAELRGLRGKRSDPVHRNKSRKDQ